MRLKFKNWQPLLGHIILHFLKKAKINTLFQSMTTHTEEHQRKGCRWGGGGGAGGIYRTLFFGFY
jgi:hypothetical protein